MKPFDLEKALAGEPVKKKNHAGKCFITGQSRLKPNCYIVEGEYQTSIEDLEELKNEFEMWEPKLKHPRPTVTLTLPCPIKDIPEIGECVYVLIPFNDHINGGYIIKKKIFYNGVSDFLAKCLQRGFVFEKEEDAQEWLDAMRNARR